ncbi:hypothetical protein JNUCC0626_00375 [Lentzea sp. JNUCC 0626]|uniref:hypothetical protein n=1 Tax=Lentzea sp. JNUCC 0626 TaxID=3367513 RepID=UPI00374816B7
MKRLVPLLALAACSPAPPAATPSSTAPQLPTTTTTERPDPTAAIHEVFFDFTKALRDKDGDAAVATMASSTVARWESYRVHALKSTETQLTALPIGERAVVYGLRATAGPVLRDGTGHTVLVAAVQQGLITVSTSTKVVKADGTTAVNETTPDLTGLILAGDTATGEMVSSGANAPATTAGLERMAAQKGVTADQLLTQLFTAQFGAERAAELRKPLEG